jgi:glutaminyl-peptide cyclotransferase
MLLLVQFTRSILVSGVLLAIFSISLLKGASSTIFRGQSAFTATKQAVAFGERPSGSAANMKLRTWILSEVSALGCQVTTDAFTAQTPNGPLPMANIILRFSGTSGRALAVTGHFDTKKIPLVRFLGANDGGSSTGFLLEFARAIAKTPHRSDIYIVFFDGEEAVAQWTDRDSIYGSKHLAAKWANDGTLARLDALINVDMIGDSDLDVMNDSNSNEGLRQQMLKISGKLGYSKSFHQDRSAIEDDHMPFAESGVNVLDVIDFTYGPNNAYWHTAQDTIDKLSAHSFQVVGDVILTLVKTLDR